MIAIGLGWVIILMAAAGVAGIIFGIKLGIRWEKKKA